MEKGAVLPAAQLLVDLGSDLGFDWPRGHFESELGLPYDQFLG